MVKGIQYNVETGEMAEVQIDVVLPNPRILEIEQRQEEIRLSLASSDYKTLKYAEGALSEEEWTAHVAERQALRDEYNALESELTPLLD